MKFERLCISLLLIAASFFSVQSASAMGSGNPYLDAQTGLTYSLYKPVNTLGLPQTAFKVLVCGGGGEEWVYTRFSKGKRQIEVMQTMAGSHCSDPGMSVTMPSTKVNGISAKVFVYCDEFTNYNDVEIGKTTLLLLQGLGYYVEILESSISGRSYLSKGLIRKAKEIAIRNVNLYKDCISDQAPLIGIEPSAILSFRDEFIDLVPDELKDSAKQLGVNCLLFEEWFCREMDSKNIKQDQFTRTNQLIYLHGHCHQKSIASMTPTKKALSLPVGYEVRLINSGCCGMAGSFGYEKEHYEVSMKVGELVLARHAVDFRVLSRAPDGYFEQFALTAASFAGML
jgi:hypothetical protein